MCSPLLVWCFLVSFLSTLFRKPPRRWANSRKLKMANQITRCLLTPPTQFSLVYCNLHTAQILPQRCNPRQFSCTAYHPRKSGSAINVTRSGSLLISTVCKTYRAIPLPLNQSSQCTQRTGLQSICYRVLQPIIVSLQCYR